jgi:hypothetical protein
MHAISKIRQKVWQGNGHLIAKHIRGKVNILADSQQETFRRPDGMDHTPAHNQRYLQAKQKTTVVCVPRARSSSGERRRSHIRLDGAGCLCFSPSGSPGPSAQEDIIGTLSRYSTSYQLAGPPVVSVTAVSTDREPSKTSGETGSSHPAPIEVGAS